MLDAVVLFRHSLYGALVIALACSVLGVYVVLRRIVFVGAAIAQLSSAGIALALYLAGAGVVSGLEVRGVDGDVLTVTNGAAVGALLGAVATVQLGWWLRSELAGPEGPGAR